MRALIVFALLAGCAARQPLICPTDGPTKNDFIESKSYDTYEVDGDHPNTFLANAKAQKPFANDVADTAGVGLTESKLCLHWQETFDANSCRIAAVRLQHLVRITLPRWNLPENAKPAFVEWNKTTSAKLASHEEGHYLIATAAARDLYEKALAVTSAPTCEELDRQFDALLKSADVELRRKQAEFDAVTKHGTVDSAG